MKTIFGLLLIIASCRITLADEAPDQAKQRLFALAESNIFQLKVVGQKGNEPVKTKYGTGFLVKAEPLFRVLTAGHVVGNDTDYDIDSNGEVKRFIYLKVRTTLGPTEVSTPLSDARVNQQFDVAQIFTNIDFGQPLRLSRRWPKANENLWVVSWIEGQGRAQIRELSLSAPDARDAGLMRLQGQCVSSESGAPIFNMKGAVVGVLIVRDQPGNSLPSCLAVPVSELAGWKENISFGQTPEEVQDCVSASLERKRDRQPFSVELSVRCQNMGNSRDGEVRYKAPPGFHIVGQISKLDSTNFGTVDAIRYEGEPDITGVYARFRCETPLVPFGPGGWAGATLTGSIEKIITPEIKHEVTKACGEE